MKVQITKLRTPQQFGGSFFAGMSVWLALGLILACANPAPAPTDTPPPAPKPTPKATQPSTFADGGTGQAIFTAKGQCFTCHTIDGLTVGVLGPTLNGIGSDAATRQPGVSAEEYLRQSIQEPDGFVQEGCVTGVGTPCTTGVMAPIVNAANLTDADVDALVAFLLTVK